MTAGRMSLRQWTGWFGLTVVLVLATAVAVWRGDILRAGLDPQVPFQTYEPPPAPDYGDPTAWALRDARGSDTGPAAVFFVHSTTYNGGRGWNGPIGDASAEGWLKRVVLPNYAAPFARAGEVSAPRYRQGSLYTRLTLRDDAREARAFAWRDIDAAFEAWVARHPEGPIVLAGVEQGGDLVERLVRERVADEPALRARLVAVYLMDVVVAADGLSPQVPACAGRADVGCIVAWSPVSEGNDGAGRRRLRRALVWDDRGRLVDLGGRAALCVNPVTGSTDTAPVAARLHQGATNATGLEWGVRPALMAREIATQCRDGLLRHTEPTMESFRETGSWADRRKSRPYNLFYGDIEADVQARMRVWEAQQAA
ncbi:MAG: DUF3089 domain-containing protein [Brevundimonas sp.]|uniref:DUF3089 domain-containing protein n=1 Tax=Brevundimonas sp. TaxID=1871086 RepID=UPI002735D43F|nr:DUF3089 domain-containing protein [Brevundimonas sp.]MDP3656536.1 DUF3089 domain-containing protein [Brevundimonas sp.]MDZ4111111.1 DUF3089 domain-containing protein [Brevundimonas sp.]